MRYMKTSQQDISHVKDLFAEANEILARLRNDNNLIGQTHDSILIALTFSRRAREGLEGLQLETNLKELGGFE